MRTVKIKRFDGGTDTFECQTSNEFAPSVLPVDTEHIISKRRKNRRTKKMETVSLYDYFMTFDIEATTITPHEYILYEKKREKANKNIPIPAHVPRPYAFMYHWQMKVHDQLVYGHYWEEVFDTFERIRDMLNLNEHRKLLCFIHNLAYESWWMLPYLKQRYGDIELFATQPKKPLKIFIPKLGIEFRCSYRLSNMSLEKAVENEKGCIHPKAAGDLDFKKKHYPNKELNNKEFGYSMTDVVCLYEYIENKLINEDDDLFSMPLTSTAYVRRLARANCFEDPNYHRIFMNTRLDPYVLIMLYEESRGGNTHSNRYMTRRTLHDLDSWDAVSEYPYLLWTKMYPMSQFQYYGEITSMAELEYLINTYACLFRCVFKNLRLKNGVPVPYVSFSKSNCSEKLGHTGPLRFDNGRVLSVGDKSEDGAIALTLNDIDFKLMRDQYNWDEIAIADFHIAEYGYLPDGIIKTVKELFTQKCELKVQIDRLKDKKKRKIITVSELYELKNLKYMYTKKKNLLNGIFGMMYTQPVHSEIILNDELEYKEIELTYEQIAEKLDEFYESWSSFLSYAWGAWCTSHGRAHLQRLIDATNYTDPEGDESKSNIMCYCDTDSSKAIINNEQIILDINEDIIAEDERRGAYADVDGKRFYIGVFEKETTEINGGKYLEFRTLGAKKYCYLDGDGLHTTIAGVNKEKAPNELGCVDNLDEGFIFHDAGGTTLFYNQSDIHEIEENGQKFTSANNVAMIDSTYKVHLTLDYETLIMDVVLEDEPIYET